MPDADMRLVPMTSEQKRMLVAIGVTLKPILGQHLEALVAAWDAAPADPVAAILANRNTLYATGMDELMGDLRALGYPATRSDT